MQLIPAKHPKTVMPAQAGIQLWAVELEQKLDAGPRWGDGWGCIGSSVGCHRNPCHTVTTNCAELGLRDLIR